MLEKGLFSTLVLLIPWDCYSQTSYTSFSDLLRFLQPSTAQVLQSLESLKRIHAFIQPSLDWTMVGKVDAVSLLKVQHELQDLQIQDQYQRRSADQTWHVSWSSVWCQIHDLQGVLRAPKLFRSRVADILEDIYRPDIPSRPRTEVSHCEAIVEITGFE